MAPHNDEAAPLTQQSRTDPEIMACITVPDNVRCIVINGFVTLEGAVEWPSQRNTIEACVRQVAGVRGVMNYLAVMNSSVDSFERSASSAVV